jgi:DNA-3-methyladenine glycosylase II
MAFTETFTLQPSAPFNFDLTAQLFQNGDKQVRAYANGEFHQVLQVGSCDVLISVTSVGSVEQPKVAVQVKSNQPITPQTKKKTVDLITDIFNLSFDLNSLYW